MAKAPRLIEKDVESECAVTLPKEGVPTEDIVKRIELIEKLADRAEVIRKGCAGADDVPDANRPVALELFAGSGGMSAAMWDCGFDVISVDTKFNKHPPKKRKTGAEVPIMKWILGG